MLAPRRRAVRRESRGGIGVPDGMQGDGAVWKHELADRVPVRSVARRFTMKWWGDVHRRSEVALVDADRNGRVRIGCSGTSLFPHCKIRDRGVFRSGQHRTCSPWSPCFGGGAIAGRYVRGGRGARRREVRADVRRGAACAAARCMGSRRRSGGGSATRERQHREKRTDGGHPD